MHLPLKFQTIPGESQATDSKHTDWIPILSIDQDIRRPLGSA